jgi:hypothetical protein
MKPLDPRTLLLSVLATAIILAATGFLTRANSRRIAAALLGAVAIIPVIIFIDKMAARVGWWHYPSINNSVGPLAWYIAAALFYGAAFGLIGWRVIRRFKTWGLVIFLISFGLLGLARDYIYSVTTNLIVFGERPTSLIADFFAYVSGAALLQAIMYWVAGPPSSDTLRE